MKHIILDVDGCLLDYERAFGEYHNCCPKSVWIDGPTYDKDIMDMITEFNTSDDFAFMPPVAGAQQAVRNLLDDGYTITLLSSCGDSTAQFGARMHNLNRIFGDVFGDVILRPLGSSKKDDYIALSDSKAIVIDDMIHHCKSAVDVGHEAILINTPYNGDTSGFNKVANNWFEVVDLIKGKSINAVA